MFRPTEERLHRLAQPLLDHELSLKRGSYRLDESVVDATFVIAAGVGDGIGRKAGKGARTVVLVDALGLPTAVGMGSAIPH
jgi:hypothetical protein